MQQPGKAEIAAFLRRLRRQCSDDTVQLTLKATDEASDELGWETFDIVSQLEDLSSSDFHQVVQSTECPSDVIWIFKPMGVKFDDVHGTVPVQLWIRLVERDHSSILVSIHEA